MKTRSLARALRSMSVKMVARVGCVIAESAMTCMSGAMSAGRVDMFSRMEHRDVGWARCDRGHAKVVPF
jgi:hypothetical protein